MEPPERQRGNSITHKLKLAVQKDRVKTVDQQFDHEFAKFEKFAKDVSRLQKHLTSLTEHIKGYGNYSNRAVGHIGNFFQEFPGTPAQRLTQNGWRAHSRLNKAKLSPSLKTKRVLAAMQAIRQLASKRETSRKEMDYYQAKVTKLQAKRDTLAVNGKAEKGEVSERRVRNEYEHVMAQEQYQCLNSQLVERLQVLNSNRSGLLAYIMKDYVDLARQFSLQLRTAMDYTFKIPDRRSSAVTGSNGDNIGTMLKHAEARRVATGVLSANSGPPSLPSNLQPRSQTTQPTNPSSHIRPHSNNGIRVHPLTQPPPRQMPDNHSVDNKIVHRIHSEPHSTYHPAETAADGTAEKASRTAEEPQKQTAAGCDMFNVPNMIPRGLPGHQGDVKASTLLIPPSATKPATLLRGWQSAAVLAGTAASGHAHTLPRIQHTKVTPKKKLRKPCPFLAMGIECAVGDDAEHMSLYYHTDEEACQVAARPCDWVEQQHDWHFHIPDPNVMYNQSDTDNEGELDHQPHFPLEVPSGATSRARTPQLASPRNKHRNARARRYSFDGQHPPSRAPPLTPTTKSADFSTSATWELRTRSSHSRAGKHTIAEDASPHPLAYQAPAPPLTPVFKSAVPPPITPSRQTSPPSRRPPPSPLLLGFEGDRPAPPSRRPPAPTRKPPAAAQECAVCRQSGHTVQACPLGADVSFWSLKPSG